MIRNQYVFEIPAPPQMLIDELVDMVLTDFDIDSLEYFYDFDKSKKFFNTNFPDVSHYSSNKTGIFKHYDIKNSAFMNYYKNVFRGRGAFFFVNYANSNVVCHTDVTRSISFNIPLNEQPKCKTSWYTAKSELTREKQFITIIPQEKVFTYSLNPEHAVFFNVKEPHDVQFHEDENDIPRLSFNINVDGIEFDQLKNVL